MHVYTLLLVFNLLFPSVFLAQWTHLGGSRQINANADYVTPYPGSLAALGMAEESGFIYVFGGEGYNDTSFGMYVLVSNG